MVLAKGQTHRPMKQARQSRNKTHKYGQFLTKAQQRKDSLFNKWYWVYGCPYTKQKYLDTPHTLYKN